LSNAHFSNRAAAGWDRVMCCKEATALAKALPAREKLPKVQAKRLRSLRLHGI
jgi:hypothetical protein